MHNYLFLGMFEAHLYITLNLFRINHSYHCIYFINIVNII